MERTLDGQVVFITGAASGIGRACAFTLAERGAAVAVVDVDSPHCDHGAAGRTDS